MFSFQQVLKIWFLILLYCWLKPAHSQYLSNLSCTSRDPVFTTYAAPIHRSDYRLDQGYRLMWYDDERNIEFISQDGGNIGVMMIKDGEIRSALNQFYREPVITASYPDLVKFNFYPFKNIRVVVFFNVYSSTSCFISWAITNEGKQDAYVKIIPYFYLDRKMEDVESVENYFTFSHHKERDGWMKDHDIPYAENLQSVFMMDEADESGTYGNLPAPDSLISGQLNGEISPDSHYLVFGKNLLIKSGETKTIRVMRGLDRGDADTQALIDETAKLKHIVPQGLIHENESLFDNIPKIHFSDPGQEAVYWNSFNLIRQCMMPPEGECKNNYYVFSREPKWGWGYGGQVFHESLVMLAYAFMDPESAMNSQRVYMNRQWPSGYINYRTGPYLNEQIETNGEYTSSAPWYNYQNLEIYKVTRDQKFLEEAYRSGKKFYNYYVANRDKDNDGLCEWGAHAVLESVRDARVAVWKKAGWPSNFEGPDVNAMLVNEARSLAEMAEKLGKPEEAAKWRKDAQKRSELINQKLWDPETGFYYNIDMQSGLFSHKAENDLKIKEIIGFLPMWAGIPDSARAAILMKSLLNPDEFWRRFGVPTLSAADDYYNPIGYWNGPVWVQWDYLIFRVLLDYGYKKEAAELATRVLDNMAYHLQNDHVFWEFYSPDEHEAGWNQTYIWAGIAARFLIDLNDLQDTGIPGK